MDVIVVILETDQKYYYNARDYWFSNHSGPEVDRPGRLQNRKYFRNWIQDQGAAIITPSDYLLLYDRAGVAPGYSQLRFDDDEQATFFVLKWS